MCVCSNFQPNFTRLFRFRHCTTTHSLLRIRQKLQLARQNATYVPTQIDLCKKSLDAARITAMNAKQYFSLLLLSLSSSLPHIRIHMSTCTNNSAGAFHREVQRAVDATRRDVEAGMRRVRHEAINCDMVAPITAQLGHAPAGARRHDQRHRFLFQLFAIYAAARCKQSLSRLPKRLRRQRQTNCFRTAYPKQVRAYRAALNKHEKSAQELLARVSSSVIIVCVSFNLQPT